MTITTSSDPLGRNTLAAGEQVVGGDAFAIFDNVGNLAAPERTGNVAAEERVLGCDLVYPA
ncbi:MAG: hypothetical protein WB559_07225 [Candidatus Acidiferrales bacterium]